MAPPRKTRFIRFNPNVYYFKPRGIPLPHLEEVQLKLEEAEALRLNDVLNLEQNVAAKRMRISQSTFQRILTRARKKVADAIITGKAIAIDRSVSKKSKADLS